MGAEIGQKSGTGDSISPTQGVIFGASFEAKFPIQPFFSCIVWRNSRRGAEIGWKLGTQDFISPA
jgi:hypothetical protein